MCTYSRASPCVWDLFLLQMVVAYLYLLNSLTLASNRKNSSYCTFFVVIGHFLTASLSSTLTFYQLWRHPCPAEPRRASPCPGMWQLCSVSPVVCIHISVARFTPILYTALRQFCWVSVKFVSVLHLSGVSPGVIASITVTSVILLVSSLVERCRSKTFRKASVSDIFSPRQSFRLDDNSIPCYPHRRESCPLSVLQAVLLFVVHGRELGSWSY